MIMPPCFDLDLNGFIQSHADDVQEHAGLAILAVEESFIPSSSQD
jgi:hypothetical protein